MIVDKDSFIKNIRHFSLLVGRWILIIIAIRLYGVEGLEVSNILLSAGFVLISSLVIGVICAIYVDFKDREPPK